MSKKVTIGSRPSKQAASADSWVENPEQGKKMKRITLEVSETLHRQIKTQCAARGTKIAEELRELLAEKYGKM